MALAHLFDDLKSARTEDEAARIVTQIDGQFRQSGSDTLDLLAAHAREAMSKGEFPVAVEIISRVIAMQADWAEAWNERASVFFMMGDYDRAKADIIEALSREPRQIGALTGLALIYEVQDQPKEALKAYRQVLALAPQLKPVKSAVARLAKEFEQPM